jgi:hypothetical protein
MTSVRQVADALRHVLREVPAAHARESGFCHRRSKLTAEVFVQTLVLGWLANPAASLAELTTVAAAQGVAISPQGLDQRFGPPAASLLEAVLAQAIAQTIAADPAMTPTLAAFTAVLVLDSTTISLPDAFAEQWAGCGGRVAHQGRAAVKATVQLDLRGGGLSGPELSAGRTPDRQSALLHAPVPPGALRIGDLGFWSLGVFAEMAQDQAFFLSRLHPQVRLFVAETGEPLELLGWLETQAGDAHELAVELGLAARLPAWLLAVRTPAPVAAARADRIREQARQRGERPNPRALERAGWQLLITNAPPERLPTTAALVVARSRWQIELLFKRWKAVGKLDASRSANPAWVQAEFLAKLIAALLSHWLLVLGAWARADRSLTRADAVIRSHALWLGRALPSRRRLRAILAERVQLLAACARLTKRRSPNSAQLLAHPDLVVLA